MKSVSRQKEKKIDIGTLSVVKNFRQVIEDRDISLMNQELYQFLNLYCGFIAHYDIHGFRATYQSPRDFADVFIRHFDKSHCYFCNNYSCHDEPYQKTGFTKAEIKREFFLVVEQAKEAVSRWADNLERDLRYAGFQALKKEFEEEERNVHLECKICGESIDFKISPKGREPHTLGNIYCLFCGQPIHINQKGGENYVE